MITLRFSWLFLITFCSLYLGINVFVVSGNCLGNQQSLLLQLKKELTFSPATSRKLVQWTLIHDCCNWASVTCNEGRVTGLDLSQEFITQGIGDSSSLFSLQFLQTLNLAYNKFTSKFPTGFYKLRNLQHLNLSNAGFVGQILIEISQLTRLVILDISNTSLPYSDSVLKFENPNLSLFVQNLNEIRELYLDGVNLSPKGNEWSCALSSMPNLRVLSLSSCNISGPFNSSLARLNYLSVIRLDQNNLTSPIPAFFANYSNLTILSLARSLKGLFLLSIFELRRLSTLQLFSNKFNGTIELREILKLEKLTTLDLSYNNLSINASVSDEQHLSSFPDMTALKLASCKLGVFPGFLKYQSSLNLLDLSNNQIQGTVPSWISELDFISHLNLSHNLLTDWEGTSRHLYDNLMILDLHSNQLQGPVSIFPPYINYLDYSSNNFSSVLPKDVGYYISSTIFFSLSRNNFEGSIPESICDAPTLQVLDLSYNNFNGTIPHCLTRSHTPVVLNLRENQLNGNISDTFPEACSLKTLHLHGNQLGGAVPLSLANCMELEVLDLGKNQIMDTFPCVLKKISTLRVLVLRTNKFHGPIGCPMIHGTWKMLQIVDIAFNSFTSKIPLKFLITWDAMTADEDEIQSELDHIQFKVFNYTGLYYQDAITVISKGLQLELVKILTVFTSIDFSSNHFEGPIPEELGKLKALYVLNLSHNAFSGKLLSSFGNLRGLESLDLSSNCLSGTIPTQLASLNFLSFLNLSFNHLVGRIPTSTQLQSFLETSFQRNDGLCGPPLTKNCTSDGSSPPAYEKPYSDSGNSIDWNFLSAEMGFVFGLGIVVGALLFWKKWRMWYCKCADKILCRIFPQLNLEYESHGGQSYTVLRWRN
ncbi:Receptor-like protein [Quillaja saponaria]|uniref:Receptor-like protein n=1 Tax=Quillaja saponaria TaxID=32244 RepID=A0AAD7LN39_QUISA|nr:Receptor-like protein [Quillaja saponaria]